jgi:hypothetical protein
MKKQQQQQFVGLKPADETIDDIFDALAKALSKYCPKYFVPMIVGDVKKEYYSILRERAAGKKDPADNAV